MKNQINKIQAIKLVENRCDFALQRHLFHVASAMESMAVHLGYEKDKQTWHIVGLLHDIDWNDTIKQPEKHCGNETMEYLHNHGVSDEICNAIQSHYHVTGVSRDTDLKKTLFAVDELSGFSVAVALMRPTKMVDMEAKSVIKKMKDKAFAAAVSREDMKSCHEYFNLEVPTVLNIILPGFKKIASDWKLAN